MKKLSTLCFEDELSSKFKDKTKNLFGMPLDGVGVAIENLIGGCLMAEGYGLFLAGLAAGCNPLIMCGGVGMIGLGFFLMVDSNGIITDSTNLTRLGFTVIDLGLTFSPATLLEKHMVKVLKIIDKIEIIWLGGNELNYKDNLEYNFKQDIEAVKIVLNSKVKLIILPCKNVISKLKIDINTLKKNIGNKSVLSDYLINRFYIMEYKKKELYGIYQLSLI